MEIVGMEEEWRERESWMMVLWLLRIWAQSKLEFFLHCHGIAVRVGNPVPNNKNDWAVTGYKRACWSKGKIYFRAASIMLPIPCRRVDGRDALCLERAYEYSKKMDESTTECPQRSLARRNFLNL